MTLQKQLAHINITGNVERKDDGFLVIPSKLTRADDVVWDDASTPIVRGGQSKVSTSLITGNAYRMFVHSGISLIEHSGGLHRVWKSGGSSQVLNPTTLAGHTAASHFRRAAATTSRIASVIPMATAPGGANQIPVYDGSYDCASLGNYTCYAFETRSLRHTYQGVRVIVIDDSTGFTVYDNTVGDSSNIFVKPRVVGIGTKFYVYYGVFAGTGAATAFVIQNLTVTTAGTATTNSFATTFNTSFTTETAGEEILFDVAATSDATKLGLVVRSYDGGAWNIRFFSLSLSDGYTELANLTAAISAKALTLTALFTKDDTDDYKLHAFYSLTDSTLVKAVGWNVTDAAGFGPTTVGTGPTSTACWRIAAYEASSTAIYLAWDCVTTVATTTYSSTLRVSSFTHAYATVTECAGFAPWFIAGRIAVVNSRLYLPMAFLSYESYQGTTYLVDLSSVLANLGTSGDTGAAPHVVARIDYGECALNEDRLKQVTRVPGAPVRSNSVIVPYLKYETDLRVVGGVNETPWAIARALVDFDSQLGQVEVNGLAVLAGACPHVYDGSNYVEEGFHHAPEIVGGTTGAASGTHQFNTSSGTYTICCTVAWQDARGNWHESPPSNEVTVNITGPTDIYITPVVIEPPTQKPRARLVWYRTQRSSTDTTLYTWEDQYGVSVTDDTVLAAGEALYTTGDVLPNEPMPACRHLSLYQGRVVASGTGDGSGVAWSKETERGYGVEFCSSDPLHRLRVPASLGRAVGAQEVDDRLFILCERGVGIIYGTGPSATGLAGGYSDFNTIITETGCDWSSPKSIARAPEGIWFFSPFGIRLISRAGGLARGQDGKQVGAEVDDLVLGVSSPRVVAVSGSGKQQVRFYFDTTDGNVGRVLVWDYQWQKWSRFTGHAHVDACYADDRYYHVNNVSSVAQLRYYDETAIRDVNDYGQTEQGFAGTIETAWLQFAGIQGFQRIYRLTVLGKNTNTQPVTLVGSFFYDFSSTADSDVMTVTSVTPAASGVVQVQHHMVRQKCEALKIRIEMNANATVPATSGRFRLTDLTLQVGVKPGYYKLPSSQRY